MSEFSKITLMFYENTRAYSFIIVYLEYIHKKYDFTFYKYERTLKTF